ncbi:LysM peptidoglycan-binding domain-containing protein [Pseudoclavibacter chungangensis]|uniref:LysM peptidoglycan-binding domain-containing protein n=1 Tax=Pseudoclavibacter chungangensis TaxID=587635 RepID=A0A7J5BZL5_9MICO|nr:LysM peptidoglycan-binding domain-containing protein [Pseudoclavibacter chungangensis]KAB1660097.1 LysM peptidoglycan-binding domain-containing protein [Pseudoclavibacter chungangensis]NYJ66800.1 LysM repeat protein [Pseudoclavibacter chungangensis]
MTSSTNDSVPRRALRLLATAGTTVRAVAARWRSAQATATAPVPRGTVHVVVVGETAESVALAHDVSTASLLVRNGLRLRGPLVPGTRLVVDDACRGVRAHGADEIPRHHVSDDDTLEGIARTHRVSPRVLLHANELACAASIAPGMTLVVPRSTDARDTGEIPVIRPVEAGHGGVSSAA